MLIGAWQSDLAGTFEDFSLSCIFNFYCNTSFSTYPQCSDKKDGDHDAFAVRAYVRVCVSMWLHFDNV